MHKIRFVVNPIAGAQYGKQKLVRMIEDTFTAAGREFDLVYSSGRGDGIRLAKQGVEEGFEVIAAVGGDGTINEVGQGLFGSGSALGVIPAGSGNGFARNFNIPLNIHEAIRLLLSPQIISIDVGKINRRYFLNVAGIGLDAAISKNFDRYGRRGSFTYFLVGLKTFFSYKPAPLTLRFAERVFTTAPLVLSIANAPQYGSGAIIAPRAKPDDGLLDVCIVDQLPLSKLAHNLRRLFTGTIDQMEGYQSFQTASLTIQRQAPGVIHTDGDPYQEDALLQVDVLPGKLRVVVGN